MCLTNHAFLNMVADLENSETLKGFPTFDGKDPEQSRQEIRSTTEKEIQSGRQ